MSLLQQAGSSRLKLSGISKSFPGCVANADIDLAVAPGEIHALLGENGAGKSTLVKIIYGLLKADSGEMIWEGKPVDITDPAAARALGIGMVFQHFSLIEALTVAENIALGIPGPFNLKEVVRKLSQIGGKYGLHISPNQKVGDLSVGECQRVEIIRCLMQSPRLMIMDEPTSVLTPQESERLFETLEQLRAEGVSILYITHKLDEVRQLCQRATLLRGGRVVAELDPREHAARELAELMVGAELREPRRTGRAGIGKVVFSAAGISGANSVATGDLRDVSFDLPEGEILGIAGMAGNGQSALLSVLSGEVIVEPEQVRLKKQNIGHLGASERRTKGLAFAPEERLGRAAVPQLSLAENAFLSAHKTESLCAPVTGLIYPARVAEFTQKVCASFKVRYSSIDNQAAHLSGGNLQKFIVGREILQKPDVLLTSQPTWGVDAGSAAMIHQALLDLAESGVAVLLISQDLDEIFALSDRIAVLSNGRLSKVYDRAEVTLNDIGLLMGESSAGEDRPRAGHAAH